MTLLYVLYNYYMILYVFYCGGTTVMVGITYSHTQSPKTMSVV